MLPVPTREAVDSISAPKEDTAPSVRGFSRTTRKASRTMRNCTKPVQMVKVSPAATRNSGTQGVYRKSLIRRIRPSIISVISPRSLSNTYG